MAAGKVIGSGRRLAAELDVAESTVREYLARPDWPVRAGPPWSKADIEAIQAWRKSLQENRARDAGMANKASTLLKVESAKIKQIQRKRLEGVVIDRALLDAALEALTRLFVGELMELERALPHTIAGLDPGQVEKVVKDRVRSIREQLAGRQVIELQSIEQAVRTQSLPKARGRPGRGR